MNEINNNKILGIRKGGVFDDVYTLRNSCVHLPCIQKRSTDRLNIKLDTVWMILHYSKDTRTSVMWADGYIKLVYNIITISQTGYNAFISSKQKQVGLSHSYRLIYGHTVEHWSWEDVHTARVVVSRFSMYFWEIKIWLVLLTRGCGIVTCINYRCQL